MYDALYRSAPLALAPSHKDPLPAHLFLRQQHTVEIIQLVEVQAPPPRQQLPSDFASSSASSSSDASSAASSSDVPSDAHPQSEHCATSESADSESICSSYCSSDEDEMRERKIMFYDDTYGTRLTRVLAWRESFANAMGICDIASHTPLSALQKRKLDYDQEPFDDSSSSSHSSKRSRSHSPEPEWMSAHPRFSLPAHPHAQPRSTHRRLSAHSCPACDECFTTQQHLQQHGQDPLLGDACRVAVQYGLES